MYSLSYAKLGALSKPACFSTEKNIRYPGHANSEASECKLTHF